MENQLTLEQALQNIKIVLEKYLGTKHEHIALEQSYNIIVEALKTKEKE
jgi:predicted RNase H-like HicB family nuclease